MAGAPGAAKASTADPADAGLDALDAGDFAAAVPLLERAIEREPDDALLHYGLGVAAAQLGREVTAARALERAAELDPEMPGVQAEVGLALSRIGEHARAEPHLLESLVQGPEDADVLLQLGLLDADRGETKRALRLFSEAAAVDPGLAATAWYEAAGVALELDDLEGAVEYLERSAAAEGPESAKRRSAELLAALQPAPLRRVSLSAGAGVEYDDNLTVIPADLTTGVGDVAAVMDLGVNLYAVRRADVQLSAGYDFYQSLYRNLTGLNLQSHSPYVRLAAGEGRLFGAASYRYTNDSLGGDGFLSTHRGEIEMEIVATAWLSGLIGIRIEGLDFDQTPERSAERLAVPIGARVRDPENPISLELTWRPVWSDAKGSEFDFRGDVVTTGLFWGVPVGPRVIDLRFTYDWDGRDYVNVTPQIRRPREDSRHLFGTGASILLFGPTEISFDYLHISASSNIPELNYTENIVTLRLGAFY